MLYEIGKELETELERKKVPYKVIYGPQNREDRSHTSRSRVTLERDRQAGDQFLPGRPIQINPPLDHVRAIGSVLRIYTKSNKHGARIEDHERECDSVLDAVEVGLRRVITARKTRWRITAQKLLSAVDLDQLGISAWPGVIYEMRFQVDRGVFDSSFDGSGVETAEPGENDMHIRTPTTEVNAAKYTGPNETC